MQESFIPITLPSKCLPYKDVDPNSIQIRSFKGRDEKLIAELSYDNFDKKSITILSQVVKGVDPAKITLGDRLFLLIWEVIHSYDKDYQIEFECEHCWQKIEHTVDLSKLEIIELSKDFQQPYSLKLPDSGKSINLKLLTVSDLIQTNDIEKLGQNVWLYKYALSIISEDGIWERVEFLENLSTKDLAIIRAFHEKFAHGPKLETKYECPHCGGTGVMPVPFRLEMLFPYGKRLTKYFRNAV